MSDAAPDLAVEHVAVARVCQDDGESSGIGKRAVRTVRQVPSTRVLASGCVRGWRTGEQADDVGDGGTSDFAPQRRAEARQERVDECASSVKPLESA